MLKSDLKLILITVVTVALVVLPLFACDYPMQDKTRLFKILQDWPMKVDILVE
jgi:hypothetical protein